MTYQNKSLWLPLVTLIVLLFCPTSTTPAQTVPEIAEKALAATVYLEMQDSNGKTLGFGSGFFVKPNLIATNYHVIAGASSGTAKLVGKSTTYKIEGRTATSKYDDLVLLKVSVSGINPLPLGNSDAVKIGETVYVAGNPKGLEGTFSDGIISGRHGGPAKGRIQITAPISPGSSGGPMLNNKGEVIGIAFMTIEGGQNLNFAIPSLYLKTLLSLSGTVKPLSQGNHTISAETYFVRGNAKAALGQYSAAISDYGKVIQLKPDAVNAYYNRGVTKAKLDQHIAAIGDFDKAIQLKPDLAEVYFNRGLAKASLKRYSAAISDYDKTIQLKPDYAEAYNDRGVAKYKLGQHVAAISDFDKAIQLKPDYASIYYNRGAVKQNLGQSAAAIQNFDKAIQLEPDDAKTYNDRGNAKHHLGQLAAAIQDFDKAIQLEPDDADAYYNRGLTKGKLNQHSAAIQDFDKAIQLEPDDAMAYLNRGISKELLKRTWEAKQDIRRALRIAEKTGDKNLKAKIEEVLRLLE